MLFNSLEYLFVFLPTVVLVYHLLQRGRLSQWAGPWLVVASLAFYSYWNPVYLPLLLSSLLFNHTLGRFLSTPDLRLRKAVLGLGIVFNVGLLAYFKYADFLVDNVGRLLGSEPVDTGIILPLAISFFTFQQIAWLVDRYQGRAEGTDLLNYALFVSFFPQLISGPIVHHGEMMPQFKALTGRRVDGESLALGVFLMSLGLFKKCVVADGFVVWANLGFDAGRDLNLLESWSAGLSYSLYVYFDFSGYTDMALGAAAIFGIKLPLNFNSPYKAADIQDFWRRWHMTLSRWMRDYIYIPLGGNRRGPGRALWYAFVTMLVGGLWHGAGWNFVLWGGMHGVALVIHRLWTRAGGSMPRALGVLVTFLFHTCALVVFRSGTFDDTLRIYRGMVGLGLPMAEDFTLPGVDFVFGNTVAFPAALVLALLAIWGLPNSMQIAGRLPGAGFLRFRPSVAMGVAAGLAAGFGLLTLLMVQASEFLYFNF